MSNHFKGLLYQPAYDPNHLLLPTHTKGSVHTSRVVEDQNKESSLAEWRAANEFYFKSLASVQLMLNIERKHSDITSEQVGFPKLVIYTRASLNPILTCCFKFLLSSH